MGESVTYSKKGKKQKASKGTKRKKNGAAPDLVPAEEKMETTITPTAETDSPPTEDVITREKTWIDDLFAAIANAYDTLDQGSAAVTPDEK
eukprot:6922296-Alexandrium_andersonii.AAC.1